MKSEVNETENNAISHIRVNCVMIATSEKIVPTNSFRAKFLYKRSENNINVLKHETYNRANVEQRAISDDNVPLSIFPLKSLRITFDL